MKMEDDILIEQFLKHQLSAEENTAFLKRMETDTSFKEQVQLEQQLLDALGETYWSYATNNTHAKIEAYKNILESDDTQQLKLTISEAIETYKRKASKDAKTIHRRSNFRFAIKIAAMFLIFCSVIWYFTSDNVNYEVLTEKAWNKNVGLDFTVRSNPSDSVRASLDEALHLYKQERYNEVLTALQHYDTASKHYKDVLLLRALSHYKLHQPKTAFKTLDTLKTYAPNIANWYTGLFHLGENNLKKASLYLEIPPTSNQEIKLKK